MSNTDKKDPISGKAIRKSGEIHQDLERLGREFVEALRLEMVDLGMGHLTQIIASNPATWSGGFSIHNFAEQAIREAAVEGIRSHIEHGM